jgi:hypothetical protein
LKQTDAFDEAFDNLTTQAETQTTSNPSRNEIFRRPYRCYICLAPFPDTSCLSRHQVSHFEKTDLKDDNDAIVENCQTAPASSISDDDYLSRSIETKGKDFTRAFLKPLKLLRKAPGSNNGCHFSAIPTSRVSPPSSTGFDTLSSFSDEETDWGEDESDISLYNIGTARVSQNSGTQGHINGEQDLVRPVLSPVKQAVVDRVMKKFWAIFYAETAGSR